MFLGSLWKEGLWNFWARNYIEHWELSGLFCGAWKKAESRADDGGLARDVSKGSKDSIGSCELRL